MSTDFQNPVLQRGEQSSAIHSVDILPAKSPSMFTEGLFSLEQLDDLSHLRR